ncbi:hypothetical protein SDC9_130974 [bioreactor metagenome]|uniref:Uncharacterized protein n=1 Tax=bioreactor metagenome TaxID=1076179 RepID=A0A645D3N3_9ZZZZ
MGKILKISGYIFVGLLLLGSYVGSSSPAKPSTPSQAIVKAPLQEYKFVTTQDLSGNRYSVTVIVKKQLNIEEMDSIAKEVVDKSMAKYKNIYGLYVNFTDTDIAGIPNNLLGSYEYGPDGSASFDKDKINSKKSLKLTKDHLNRDWSKQPTEDDYKIYTLYIEYLVRNPGGDVASFVNQFSGPKPTPGQIDAIYNKVNFWLLAG